MSKRIDRSWRVYKRDRGICALCGVDTEELSRRLHKRIEGGDHATWFARWDNICRAHGYSAKVRFWAVDHIIPFSAGGSCDMENLRTLCMPCHHRVTAEQGRSGAIDRRRKQRIA
jgi:5-methylcytosine-specific restriction endonuclease McrA